MAAAYAPLDALFSGAWAPIASLRPRLRQHVAIHRALYRGELWYVMQDRATGRFHRFSPGAYFFVGLMDGTRTLDELWHVALGRLADDAPTQDETIQLLAALHRAGALQTDRTPDLDEMRMRGELERKVGGRFKLSNPLAVRIPLIDPDAFLRATLHWVRPLFGWAGAVLWLAVVGAGLAIMALHWNALSDNVTDRVFALENLALMWCIFPLVKLLHELGHGYATRRLGGEVHDMGVMLLVFTPVPYVDASASTALQDKRQRMLVGAAGILVELFLAGLALIVWAAAEPGMVRAIAFNVVLIAGVSTLLFNGNPLLRYDGYYILSDWLEIPNLGQRGVDYLGYLTRRYLFGATTEAAPQISAREKWWLALHAIGAFFYRLFVMFGIALAVASHYFFVGVVLALYALYVSLVRPVAMRLGYVAASPALRGHRGRAVFTLCLLAAAIAAVLAYWPAPAFVRAEGIVAGPEESMLRSPRDAFVRQVRAEQNQRVERGAVLVELEDPELNAKVAALDAQWHEATARYQAYTADPFERVRAGIALEEMQQAKARLDEAGQRAGELALRAGMDGTFIMPEIENAEGRFAPRGELLGYVLDPANVTLQVVIAQGDVDRVSRHARRVLIRPVERMDEVIETRLMRAVPAATDQLPSLALSVQGGGQVGLDPASRMEPKSLESVFRVDLALPEARGTRRIGSRVYVLFDLEREPLGVQAYRSLRQLFLRRFDV